MSGALGLPPGGYLGTEKYCLWAYEALDFKGPICFWQWEVERFCVAKTCFWLYCR